MILHLVNDEKVIPRTIELFEKYLPGQNCFLCFQDNEGPLTHLGSTNSNYLLVYKSGEDYSLFVKQFDRVVIHFLNRRKIEFCNRFLSEKVKIIWIVWGGDLYGFLYRRGFRLFTSDNSYFKHRWFLQLFYHLTLPFNYEDLLFRRFIRHRVTDVGILPNEYELLSKYFSHPAKKIVGGFFYYPIDTVLGPLIGSMVDKKSKAVLCGNCASITNNHETAFKYLKMVIDEDTKVITPLSYGGTKWYKDKVSNSAQKMIGESFSPLYDFLPIEEYNKILISASVCVFANRRQEAMGNILIALYMGAKVYLLESNPLYAFFNDLGVTVYPLNDSITKDNFWNDIDDTTILKNRQLLLKTYNEEQLKTCIQTNFNSTIQ